MDFFEFNNQEEYNNFLTVQKFPPFQQSWQWGDFQKEYGRKVFRLAVKDGGDIQLTAQIIKIPLPLGKSYFYCPRGPVICQPAFEGERTSARFQMHVFINNLKPLAQREKAIFFRFDPPWPKVLDEIKKEFHLKKTDSIQPQDTLILNLEKSEDELFAQMKPKTRYNIRLAQRKNVTVRNSTDEKDIDIFLGLLKLTCQRQTIKPHPDNYYRKMIQLLTRQGILKMYVAEYNSKPLVANLVVNFGQVATYVHGASSEEDKNVMAPHLAQWQAIKDAQTARVKIYDFFGIAPNGSSKEKPWQGITRFKTGFGRQEIHYAGAFDLTFQMGWSRIYRAIHGLKGQR